MRVAHKNNTAQIVHKFQLFSKTIMLLSKRNEYNDTYVRLIALYMYNTRIFHIHTYMMYK